MLAEVIQEAIHESLHVTSCSIARKDSFTFKYIPGMFSQIEI